MSKIVLDPSRREFLEETIQAASDQACGKLGTLFNRPITAEKPSVELLNPQDISMHLNRLIANDTSAVCQAFMGNGLAGETMITFTDIDFEQMAFMLNYPEHKTQTAEKEIIIEAANAVSGACLKAIAESLDAQFSFGTPILLNYKEEMFHELELGTFTWEQALVMEFVFSLDDQHIQQADVFVVQAEAATKRLFDKLAFLID